MSDVLRQALCCECGNLRTFREGYTPRNWIGEGSHHNVEWHRERHAEAVERLLAGDTRLKRSRDHWVRHADPFERYTFDLKCQPCGQILKHALVPPPRPVGDRDPSEAWDHGWDSVWDDTQGAFVWRRRDGWRRPGGRDPSDRGVTHRGLRAAGGPRVLARPQGLTGW